MKQIGVIFLFLIFSLPDGLQASPIKIGFYYDQWDENLLSDVEAMLQDAGRMARVNFQLSFVKPAPILLPFKAGFHRDSGGERHVQGLNATDAWMRLREVPAVQKDLNRVSFLFVVTRRTILNRKTDISVSSGGVAFGISYHVVYGVHIYCEHVSISFLDLDIDQDGDRVWTFLHELGHMLGLSHLSLEQCRETNFFMCPHLGFVWSAVLALRETKGKWLMSQVFKKRMATIQMGEAYERAVKKFLLRKK
jgi:hypothetical protein